MYQNCCKKCGSTDLYTDQNGNNKSLYSDVYKVDAELHTTDNPRDNRTIRQEII